MATVFRQPLFTRVPARDSSAALATSLLRGSSRALLSAVVAIPASTVSHFPNPVPRQFSPELRTLLNSLVPQLISNLPAAGFSWNETPGPRKVQQPDITPNVTLLAQPVIVPFSQLSWPNPTLPDRFGVQRGTSFRNFQTSAPVVGSPLVGANPESWDNPTRPSTAVYRMQWSQGSTAAHITPPPISVPGKITGLYIGWRIGF